jgi:LAO/AO transport system kinase
VVSKADLDGAVALRDDVRRALELAAPSSGAPVPAVLLLAAARNEGVAELVAELDAHLASSLASGALQARRRRSVAARIEAICRELLATRYAASAGTFGLDALAGKVLDGELDAYSAAEIVLGT